MRRRLLPATLLLSAVAIAASGCVFVPSMVSGEEPVETILDPPAPSESSETSEPSESADPPESTESDETTNAEAQWPAEVPVPEGDRIEGEDEPLFYMVSGDSASYEEYTQQLKDAGFTLDYESDEASKWTGHGYDVFVMLLLGYLTVDVEAS